MEGVDFLRSWPGPMLLVWGSGAMRAAIAHLNTTLPHAIGAAVPQHPALAVVFIGQPVKGVVTQLYGRPPTLLVDASVFEHTLCDCFKGNRSWDVSSVCLPPHLFTGAKRICSGPLYEAVFVQVDDEEVPSLCNSYECLFDIDPEIRCDRCGAAFCSITCKFQVAHSCRE